MTCMIVFSYKVLFFVLYLLEIEYGTELNVGTVLQYVYVQVLTVFIVFREWSARGGVGEGWC